jgi:hypothetical protein
MLGSVSLGSFSLGGGAPALVDLPRIDLPTFIVLDPRTTTATLYDPDVSVTVDPYLDAAVLDPQTTYTTIDG